MKIEDNPKVSIIIPAHNGSNYLEQAIDSALRQTYENVEVIVVNDGSNDEGATEKIAKYYGDRIRYFHKENGGVASALNFGIQKMTGSYFSWLSHDDLYEKTKIEDQVRLALSLQTDNTIIVCNARVLFQNGIKKKGLIDKKTFKYFDIFLAISADVGINGCTLLIPKKAFVESGGFDVNLPVTQDYDLWFRLSHTYKYKFVLLEKNLVVYRRHDEQDSVKKQQMCLEAADDLHYEILDNVDYEQFKNYLLDDKANTKYIWRNYNLYKTRGYKKTASMMLKSILRYYYENDLEKFYRIYDSEIGTSIGYGHTSSRGTRRRTIFRRRSESTNKARQRMILEYEELLSSGTNDYPIQESSSANKSLHTRTGIRGKFRRFDESINRDGMYLTGEKIIRRVHAKVTKNKRQ